MYEEYLKKKRPTRDTITYDISELFEFIDDLKDLSMLVYDQVSRIPVLHLSTCVFQNTHTYVPRNKQFVKESIFNLMQSRLSEHN